MTNYTTIEQSKHLLELGLKAETADMHYLLIGDIDSGKNIISNNCPVEVGKPYNEMTLPCWSTGALLELMPLSIVGWDNETYTRYFIGNCAEYATGTSKYDKCLISIPSDSMFKCIYSMVKWLLQNNHIKTE